MPTELKSRAKRILTIQLPMSEQSPRFPATRQAVRRNKVVKHIAEPVSHMEQVSLPPVLTILPGESVVVPDSFLKLEPIKHAIRARHIITKPVAIKAPAPQPLRAPTAPGVRPGTTPKKSRARK